MMYDPFTWTHLRSYLHSKQNEFLGIFICAQAQHRENVRNVPPRNAGQIGIKSNNHQNIIEKNAAPLKDTELINLIIPHWREYLSWLSHILSQGDHHMKKHAWKTYTFWIVLTEAVGAFSGWLTKEGTRVFNETILQPPLSPPSIVFPIVWGILYALMGISAARISLSPPSRERNMGLNLFVAQLVVNFFWSLIFFNAQAFGLAFLWLLCLWFLVLWMIFMFRKTDPFAAELQIPYLLWLTFAAYLSFGVWYLNR